MIPHSVVAKMCQIVYEEDPQARYNLYRDHGYLLEATFQISDDLVDIVRDQHSEHWGIINRGTQSDGMQMIADWGANMRIMRWHDWRVGLCQKGHLRGAQKLWENHRLVSQNENMKEMVNRIVVTGASVTFGGHSRGGGLANLEAGMFISELLDTGLIDRSPAKLYVVTFGAPRISMNKLKKLLHRHTCGVWNYAHTIKNKKGNGDPVPKIMPRLRWVWPYIHPNRIDLKAPPEESSVGCHSIHRYYSSIRKIENDQRSESVRVARLCGNAARYGLRRASR